MTRRRYAWKRDPDKLLDKANRLWDLAEKAKSNKVRQQRDERYWVAIDNYGESLLLQMERERK